MTEYEKWIPQSLMTHSKQEVLEYIKKNQLYFPEHLKPKLLKWNSFPIIKFSTLEIEVCFGALFYQIIQLSQKQTVRNNFVKFLNHQVNDLTFDLLISLSKFIFQKNSLNPFPQSDEFQSIGKCFQESFIYEKHVAYRNPSFYKCLNGMQVDDLNEQDLKYRIVLYVTDGKDGSIAHLFFSTNNDFQQMMQKSIEKSNENVFSTQVINSLQEDKPLKKQTRLLTFSSQNENQECPICTEIYNVNSNQAILTPCCQKKLHKECIQEDLCSKAKENLNFKNVKCCNCEQSLENNENFIKENITKQLFGEIVKKQVLASIPIKCFSCSLPIDVGQEILSQQIQIECRRCQKKLCSLCRQEYHGKNQQNQQCPSLSVEIYKAMKGQPVLVCPFCNLMQTKDDKCNHVRCFSCQKELCSACSVDRVPIISHGNHYHRQGCPDYKQWIVKGQKIDQPEFDIKKCKLCKQSNKPCEYPISLEEYKKSKNF
ncbi:unnamed protein product [Paramecium sonneborni]|uniref:RING-type domain-containing protein n=1 Tax=Paramecium sonneborni TaxID=65129 RepID=A0A8S1QIE8_9CILI|nr:unnamed protein product [Paramecium sonneborni]